MTDSWDRLKKGRRSHPSVEWGEWERKLLLGAAALLGLAYLLASPLGLRGPLFVNLEGWGILDFPGLFLLRVFASFGWIDVASISMWLARSLSFVFYLGVIWMAAKGLRELMETDPAHRITLLKRALVIGIVYLIAGAVLRGTFYALTGVGQWGIGRGRFDFSLVVPIAIAFLTRRAVVAFLEGTLLALLWQEGRARILLYGLGAAFPVGVEMVMVSNAIPLWFRNPGAGATEAIAILLPPFAAGVFASLFSTQWSEETTGPSYY